MECNNNLVFNFDESIDFPDLNNVSRFYQDVIIAFNTAYTTDEVDFKEGIMEQCIWGNKFIFVRRRKSKCVLFLRNWIRSGVNKIRDLCFIDGKLDTNVMYQKIRPKTNIASEIMLCRQALLPYQETLRSLQNSDSTDQQTCNHTKSKAFYIMLKNKTPYTEQDF